MKYLSGQIAYSPDTGAGSGVTDALAPGSSDGAAAHPEAAPWAADGMWSIGEGENTTPWHSALPEGEVRSHVETKGYTNPAELAKANYELTKLHRAGTEGMVTLPGADASPEVMNEFYGKLGRPAEPTGYEFKFGDDVKVDDGMMEFGKNTFHKAGLTPAQAQIVADDWNGFVASQTPDAEAEATANAEALTALETRWGGDLEENKAHGMRVVEALKADNPAISDVIDKVDGAIGTAAVVELLASIGRKSGELSFTDGGHGDPNDPATMTAEQAKSKIGQLEGDKEFQEKYWNAKHPEHKQAVETMMQLNAKAG